MSFTEAWTVYFQDFWAIQAFTGLLALAAGITGWQFAIYNSERWSMAYLSASLVWLVLNMMTLFIIWVTA